MNKLKEYRDNTAENTWEGCHGCDENDKNMRNTGFKEGFNQALSLDLPIKFAEWQNSLRYLGELHFNAVDGIDISAMSWEELYDYWINNIFKIE